MQGINATLIAIGEDVTAELIWNLNYKLWQKKGSCSPYERGMKKKDLKLLFEWRSVYLEAIWKFTTKCIASW